MNINAIHEPYRSEESKIKEVEDIKNKEKAKLAEEELWIKFSQDPIVKILLLKIDKEQKRLDFVAKNLASGNLDQDRLIREALIESRALDKITNLIKTGKYICPAQQTTTQQ